MTAETKAPLPESVEAALNAMVPPDRVYENWIQLPEVMGLHQETLRAHIEAQADEIERLRGAYAKAIDDIEEWGAYADEYFQKKWGLKDCIEAHREALAPKQPEPAKICNNCKGLPLYYASGPQEGQPAICPYCLQGVRG